MNITEEDCSMDHGDLGPVELYSALGATSLIVLISVPCLTLSMMIYGLYHCPSRTHQYRHYIRTIQLAPIVYMMITYPVLMFPSTMALVSMLQDLLAVSVMVVFVNFTLKYSGPLSKMDAATCPLGTPPLCCLRCCPYPRISERLEKLILLPFTITPLALSINLLINLYMSYSGLVDMHEMEANQFSFINIHNIMMIPFFVSMMYTYKIFFSVTANNLTDTNPRLRGALLLTMFVFGKTVTGIMRILTDNSVIPCVSGVSPDNVSSMISALVELFYMTVLATVLPRLYSRPWVTHLLTRDTEPSEEDKMLNI